MFRMHCHINGDKLKRLNNPRKYVYAILRRIILTNLDVALLKKVLMVMPNKYYNTATFIHYTYTFVAM